MFAGDNWHTGETYGAMSIARRFIAEVLEDKISSATLLKLRLGASYRRS